MGGHRCGVRTVGSGVERGHEGCGGAGLLERMDLVVVVEVRRPRRRGLRVRQQLEGLGLQSTLVAGRLQREQWRALGGLLVLVLRQVQRSGHTQQRVVRMGLSQQSREAHGGPTCSRSPSFLLVLVLRLMVLVLLLLQLVLLLLAAPHGCG